MVRKSGKFDGSHVEYDFQKTCPKKHSDIVLRYCEKIDNIPVDVFISREQTRLGVFTNRVRQVKMYQAECVIWCDVCQKEYVVPGYIYHYGKWRKG